MLLTLLFIAAALAAVDQLEVTEENIAAVRTTFRMESDAEARAWLHTINLSYEDMLAQESPSDPVIPPFTCAPGPPTDPSDFGPDSVGELHLHDIREVGSLGDSFSAAFGAWSRRSIFYLITEVRGVSWAVGADGTAKTVHTLPNYLQNWRHEIGGGSVGTGKVESPGAHGNQAVSGAIAEDLYEQAIALVSYYKTKLGDDFNKTWTHVNIFIGGNDACKQCKNATRHSADAYEAGIDRAIGYLHEHMPRTIVSLVPTIDVSLLYDVGGFTCSVLHAFECACGTSGDEAVRQATRELQGEYVKRTKALEEKWGNVSPTFTVVMQPFMSHTQLPRKSDGSIMMEAFALDCFHLSETGQAYASIALFNNLCEPIGFKEDYWEGPREQISCPEEGLDLAWNPQTPQKYVDAWKAHHGKD